MKKLAFMGGAAGVGLSLAALLVAQKPTHASDHLDANSLANNQMADINDVYAWMDAGGSKVNLAMTVAPFEGGTHHFGPSVQYAFHVTSRANLGLGADAVGGTETVVICTFASDTSAQCWVGNKDYVTGDPSATAGVASTSGNVRVFAGLRSDPFFFNSQGLKKAVTTVDTAIAGLAGSNGDPRDFGAGILDAAGCPHNLPASTAGALRTQLLGSAGSAGDAPCQPGEFDCFAHVNTMAIVLQVDKSLFNVGSNTVVSVWGSTHTTP